MKLPELKHYHGEPVAKELANFFVDLDKYFKAMQLESQEMKVTMMTMYLAGDTMLWWTRYKDICSGVTHIDTFEEMTQVLNQLFPECQILGMAETETAS